MEPTQHAFVISLPRAGSTLLQRLLVSNFRLEAPAEPWILLPLLWERDGGAMVTGYWGRAGRKAIDDFFKGGRPGRLEAAIRAYYHAAIDLPALRERGVCFLDKTPRYAAVGGKLVQTFPDARYILLWRSPVEVALSIMRTWERSRPLWHSYHVDFSLGTKGFADAAEAAGPRGVQVRYQDMCDEPLETLARVRDGIDLRPLRDHLTRELGDRIDGFGDPTGQAKWREIKPAKAGDARPDPALSLPAKRRLIALLHLVDPRYFALGGTTLEAEVARVRRLPVRGVRAVSDAFWLGYARIELALQLRAMLRRRDPHPRLLMT